MQMLLGPKQKEVKYFPPEFLDLGIWQNAKDINPFVIKPRYIQSRISLRFKFFPPIQDTESHILFHACSTFKFCLYRSNFPLVRQFRSMYFYLSIVSLFSSFIACRNNVVSTTCSLRSASKEG
jgi:hypothetical protein